MEKVALTYRGELVDFDHLGDIAVVDSTGKLLYSVGDPYKVAYARSSAKLIQIMPVFQSGAVDHFGLSEKEIAVMCSSHNGEDEHRETVEGILKKLGLTKENLKCGIDYPLHEPLAIQMKAKGELPNPLYGDCSGKHSGMLATALMYGESLDDYYKPEHPVQQRINKAIGDFCEMDPKDIVYGLDGCGVPVHGLPLYNFALGFAKLSRPETMPEYSDYIKRVTTACGKYPFMLGGTQVMCTDLTAATGGRLIGKRGAGGYFAVTDLENGIGITIKMNEDTDMKYFVFMEVMRQLNLASEEELEKLAYYGKDTILNNNSEVACTIKPCFTFKKYE